MRDKDSGHILAHCDKCNKPVRSMMRSRTKAGTEYFEVICHNKTEYRRVDDFDTLYKTEQVPNSSFK